MTKPESDYGRLDGQSLQSQLITHENPLVIQAAPRMLAVYSDRDGGRVGTLLWVHTKFQLCVGSETFLNNINNFVYEQ